MKKLFGLLLIPLFILVLLYFAFTKNNSAKAATVPSGFSESVFASGFSYAVHMVFAPDGRLFIGEQTGKIRVVKDGVLQPEPLLTLQVDPINENGVHGITLDPDFEKNGYIYVYYVASDPAIHNKVSRFTVTGDIVDPASEFVLLDLTDAQSNLHNGGGLVFGNDGKLLITVGEKGDTSRAQNMNSLFGKVLRMNKDGTIPTDNPFYNTLSGEYRLIYALGLRNPYNIAKQPGTGRIFINDVGQGGPEEINELIPKANYGWPLFNGSTTTPGYTNPIYEYVHNGAEPGGCAITGGAFYNPAPAPFPSDYVGDYFFTDFCSGWIYRLDLSTKTITRFTGNDVISKPTDLQVGPDGNLYVLIRPNRQGKILKYSYGNSKPSIIDISQDSVYAIGETVRLKVDAAGTYPLSYQWQKDGVNIDGATDTEYIIQQATPGSTGKYRVVVTNSVGSTISNDIDIKVINGTRPEITMTEPVEGATYKGGTVLNFSADATDLEDGVLPSTAFTWNIEFYHQNPDGSNLHVHPALGPVIGVKNGTYSIGPIGETSVDVWYRVSLEVVDSSGLKKTMYRDIHPVTTSYNVTTNPPGLQLLVNGNRYISPKTFMGVVGITQNIGVITPYVKGCGTYIFDSWNNGGAAEQEIVLGEEPATYSARMNVQVSSLQGICGKYFDNVDFSGNSVTRIDPTVDFVWGGSPISGIADDSFSIEWNGYLQVPMTNTYTIYTNSNDGVRLWIGDTKVIDNYTSHWDKEDKGQIELLAGYKYPIKIQYYDNTSRALIKLSWSSPNILKQIIPSSFLFSVLQAGDELPPGISNTGGGNTFPSPTPTATPTFTITPTPDPTFSVSVTAPAEDGFIVPTSSFKVEAKTQGTTPKKVDLYFDTTLIKSCSSLSTCAAWYSAYTSQAGNHEIKAVATSTTDQMAQATRTVVKK